jgi:hypothetical protein
MLPGNKTTAAERAEQRRIRQRRALKEHRARMRKGLATAHVVYDAAVLDMLVARRYLNDDETTDKAKVSKALSQALWDPAHAK